MKLNTLLSLVCDRTRIHVCIHDISGILRQEKLKIERRFITHTKPICDNAKLTQQGFNACINCKNASNKRAALGESLQRICPFGIYEIIRPVIIDGRVRCIVYLGNLCENMERSVDICKKSCKRLGIDDKLLINELSDTEIISDTANNGKECCNVEYYEKLCNFICDFIIQLYDSKQAVKGEEQSPNRHWCVERAEEYIRNNYENDLSLSFVANLYFISEKYLGRIFKKETGKSFHEYLCDVRLLRSTELLCTDSSIISISQLCGFANVTYFNRCFKKKYGMSPGEYRRTKKNGG